MKTTNRKMRSGAHEPAAAAKSLPLKIVMPANPRPDDPVPAMIGKLWPFLSSDEQDNICDIIVSCICDRVHWQLIQVVNGEESPIVCVDKSDWDSSKHFAKAAERLASRR